MSPEILAVAGSGLGGVVSLVVCIINNHYQSSKFQALLEYRMGELEKRVDVHNGVIERTYRLEQAAALHEEKLKVANHRIDDLERGIRV